MQVRTISEIVQTTSENSNAFSRIIETMIFSSSLCYFFENFIACQNSSNYFKKFKVSNSRNFWIVITEVD